MVFIFPRRPPRNHCRRHQFHSLQANPLEYKCSSLRHSPSLISCGISFPNLSPIVSCVDDSHLPHHPSSSTAITHHHGQTAAAAAATTAKRMALQHDPKCCATTATTCAYVCTYAICWQRRTGYENVCQLLHYPAQTNHWPSG